MQKTVEVDIMECPKCGAKMNPSQLSVTGGAVSVVNFDRKLLDGNKSSALKCFGCTKCGYIEFYAENPKVFLENEI
jgi:predicted nucleic-acid-binding Zn-ribbon protein